MALKRKYDKKEDIPEEIRSLYEEKTDGDSTVWVVSLDTDADEKKKIAEFRDNNIGLKQKLESMQEQMDKFKGIDPEKYKKALGAFTKIEQEEERKLIEDGKIDEVLSRRVASLKEKMEKDLQAAKDALKERDSKLENLRGEVSVLKIDGAVSKALEKSKLKVRPGAMDDILHRTRTVFHIDDEGKMVARSGAYGSDAEPLKMDEHVTKLFEGAPHLFESGSGGGSGGGSKGGGGNDRMIDSSDIGKHLEDVAKGKVKIRHND